MKGSVHVSFCDTKPLDPEAKLEDILDTCREYGLSTEYPSDSPPCIEDVSVEESHQLRLYRDTQQFQFHIGVPARWQDPAGSVLDIFFDATLLETNESPENQYDDWMEWFVGLVCDITLAIDPILVSAWNTSHVGEFYPLSKTVIPLESPIESDLQRIPWFGIYSETYIDQFGGRDRVLQTPAWKVEELENGSILVITTEEPWDGYESKLPADRYLLEGDDDA